MKELNPEAKTIGELLDDYRNNVISRWDCTHAPYHGADGPCDNCIKAEQKAREAIETRFKELEDKK